MNPEEAVAELRRQIGQSSMDAMDVMDAETLAMLAVTQGVLRRLATHLRGRGLETDQIVALAVGAAIQAAFMDAEEA